MGIFDSWDKKQTTKSDVEINTKYADYFQDIETVNVQIGPLNIVDIHKCPARPLVFESEGSTITYRTPSVSVGRKYEWASKQLQKEFSQSGNKQMVENLLQELAEGHDNPVVLSWGCKGLMEKTKRRIKSEGMLENTEVRMAQEEGPEGGAILTYVIDTGVCDIVYLPMFPQGEFAGDLVKAYSKYANLVGVTFVSSAGGLGSNKGTVIVPETVLQYSDKKMRNVVSSGSNGGEVQRSKGSAGWIS